MRGAEMRAFDVYVGNMNFAFLSGKGMHLKRKTAINFVRLNAFSILSRNES